MEEGIIRIKVTEAFALQLENNVIARRSDHSIVTGVKALDAVNLKYRARDMKRVFRQAGKHEEKHKKYGLHLWYEVQIGKDVPVEAAIREYSGLNLVQKAEPVYKKQIYDVAQQPRVIPSSDIRGRARSNASDDPLLPQQWHYHNTGQHEGTPGADIDLLNAWTIERGKTEVVVAIMDTGIETNHPDLAANMWVNEGEIAGNGFDDDGNGYIDDVHGYDFAMDRGIIIPGDHGTHVAGTVAAVNNNGIGVAGVAGGSGASDGVKLMSCAVFSQGPSNFASAYVYAADNGAVISQNSWGYIEPGYYEQIELEAIDYFIAEAGRDENGQQVGVMDGGLVIFATGNNYSSGRFYPGYYEPVLAVSATNNKDIKPDYSTYGTWVDISAPGGETELIAERGVLSTLTNGEYGFYQGTSMACPHVSGVAALVLSKYGGQGYTPRMLRQRLQLTGDYIDHLNPDYAGKIGMSRLNAHQALLENIGSPDAIDDLSIAKTEIGKITLTWTAPVDAGALKVSHYDVRYASFPITAENFSDATPASFPTTPKTGGEQETFAITGLANETHYYFAIRSTDFEGNVSTLSNIAEAATLPAPAIQVMPVSLHAALETNEASVQTFTIANTGRGVLLYRIATQPGDENFLSYNITKGEIAAGSSASIEVTFSAQRLLSGSYQRDIIIHHNDPGRGTVLIHALLEVTNNGTAIVQADKIDLQFKSLELGTSVPQAITLYNAGSEPLVITDIASGHPSFTSNSASFTLAPFEDSVITITFTPVTSGQIESTLSIHTNDPVHAVVTIQLRGEGLTQPPVTADPSAFDVHIPQGSQGRQVLTLTNHGSYDRSFTVAIISKGLVDPEQESKVFPNKIGQDSAMNKMEMRYEEMKAKFALLSRDQQQLVKAVVRPGVSDVSIAAQPAPMEQHITGFEDFQRGTVSGQYEWDADPEWMVTDEGAYEGKQHMGAISDGKEYGYSYPNLALSPIINTEEQENGVMLDYQKYSHTSMRINLDSARGVLWEVVPQNPYAGLVTARIQFTENGAIKILSAKKENLYEYYWQTLDEPIPSGYFTLAIECKNDEEKFNIYFNDRKVFTGYSMATPINQVAFISTMEKEGPSIAVDDFKLTFGEYIPVHIQSMLVAGTIEASGAIGIPLLFEATNIRWGVYESDIVIHFENGTQITVPATLTVSGDASITLDNFLPLRPVLQKEEERYVDTGVRIMNIGGVPLEYQIENSGNPGWLTVESRSGTIPMRGEHFIKHTLTSIGYEPGFYKDTLRILSNAPQVLAVPVDMVILEPESQLASFPQGRITRVIRQGTISEVQFEIANGGDSTLSFSIGNYLRSPAPPPWIMMEPSSGKVHKDHPQLVTVKIDASGVQGDTAIFIHSDLRANDEYANAFSGKSLFFTFYIQKALAPVLNEVDNITLRETQSHDITFTATDEDSENVSITLVNPPSFVTLKTSGNGTATYNVSPPIGTASRDEYMIEVLATDSEGNTDREYFSLLVEPYPGFAPFVLWNSKDGSTVSTFDSGVEIDRSSSDYNHLVIRATPMAENPGSMVFRLNGKHTTVNRAPYDLKLSRHASMVYGDYTLMVEGYSGRNGKGTRLYTQEVQVHFVNASTIPTFQLVDNAGTLIQVLRDGDTIEVANGQNDCIRIEATPGNSKVHHVYFDFNNGYTYTDYSAPFMSHGGNCWSPSAGNYTIYATPAWKGSYGVTGAISFTVVEKKALLAGAAQEQHGSEVTFSFTTFPVPARYELNVALKGYVNKTVSLAIVSPQGFILYRLTETVAENGVLTISTASLKPGLYFIKLLGPDGAYGAGRFIKEN